MKHARIDNMIVDRLRSPKGLQDGDMALVPAPVLAQRMAARHFQQHRRALLRDTAGGLSERDKWGQH